MTFTVRHESAADFDAVHRVTAPAFAQAPVSASPVGDDGAPGEATLVGWLRESSSYDSRFAFLAVRDGEIIGHVMATWGDVDTVPVLGVGPLSVEPTHQGQGIGSALMTTLLSAATQAGEPVVVLLGDPRYYSRFGFVLARRLDINAEPEWGDFFQACALRPSTDGIPSGVYQYAKPFARLG